MLPPVIQYRGHQYRLAATTDDAVRSAHAWVAQKQWKWNPAAGKPEILSDKIVKIPFQDPQGKAHLVFVAETKDAMERYALDIAKDRLTNEPGAFLSEWLLNFVDTSKLRAKLLPMVKTSYLDRFWQELAAATTPEARETLLVVDHSLDFPEDVNVQALDPVTLQQYLKGNAVLLSQLDDYADEYAKEQLHDLDAFLLENYGTHSPGPPRPGAPAMLDDSKLSPLLQLPEVELDIGKAAQDLVSHQETLLPLLNAKELVSLPEGGILWATD